MKKNFLIVVLGLFIAGKSVSQAPELGLFLGGGYYIGDLNPYKHFYQTKFAGGLIYRNQIKSSDRLSFRMHLFYGKVGANDVDSKFEHHVNRNLNFTSTILEIGPALEIHFLPYEIGSSKRPGTPYLFFGLNYFKMNPMGLYNNEPIELQPLGTEGQGTSQNTNQPYKLNQLSIPMGIGLKFNLTNRIALGFEYGARKTFTDYLDDVSGSYVNTNILEEEAGILAAFMSDRSLVTEGAYATNNGLLRGNPNNKDWYHFFGITINYRVKEYTTCKTKKFK
jgi:hypothetical protein